MTDEDDPFAPPRKLKTGKGAHRPVLGAKRPAKPKLRLVHGATPPQPELDEDDPFASPRSSVPVAAKPWMRQEPENPFPDPEPAGPAIAPATLRKHAFGDPFTDDLEMPFLIVSQNGNIEIVEVSINGLKTLQWCYPPYCEAIGEQAERIAVARDLVLVTGVQSFEMKMAIEEIIKLTVAAARASG